MSVPRVIETNEERVLEIVFVNNLPIQLRVTKYLIDEDGTLRLFNGNRQILASYAGMWLFIADPTYIPRQSDLVVAKAQPAGPFKKQ